MITICGLCPVLTAPAHQNTESTPTPIELSIINKGLKYYEKQFSIAYLAH